MASEIHTEAALNEKFANLIDYVTVPSDKSVKPIIANPEIEKLEDFEYNPQIEGLDLVNLNDLSVMDKEQLEQYLIQVYKFVVATTSPKDRLNMMNYFVNIIQNSNNANLIIESLFMDMFVKLLKTVKSKQFKVVLCTIIGLCLRHATNVNTDIPKLDIVPILIELVKDASVAVRRRAMAALGEYLFYGSDQIDGSPENEMWEIPFQVVSILVRALKSSSEDEVVVHYAIKTIENIVCKSKPGGAGEKFCFPEFVKVTLKIYKTSKHQGIRNSAIVCLSSVCLLAPKFIREVMGSLEIKNVFAQVSDSEKKSQQALMNLVNLYILYGDENSIRTIFDNLKTITPFMAGFFDHGSVAIKCKTLLFFTMLITEDPALLNDPQQTKVYQLIEKLAFEKNKHLKNVTREFVSLLDCQLERCVEIIDNDFESIVQAAEDEDQEPDSDLQQGYETVVEVFNLISVILSSFHVQDSIFNEEKLSRIFRLTRFYERFVAKSSQAELEISELVLMIVEQIISNRSLLNKYQIVFAGDILPLLCKGLDSKLDECRFASIKWITDIVQQIIQEDYLDDTRSYIYDMSLKHLLPRMKSILKEPNPTGSGMIKLLRTLLDFEPSFRDTMFSLDLPKVMMGYFESRSSLLVNHEKCNANTIKVISYIVDSQKTKLSSLVTDDFFEKLFTLYCNITDIVQGEEIVELLNIYYRRVFKELEIDIYALDQAKKYEKDILTLIGDRSSDLVKLHDKSVELLVETQGSHSIDILEALLCTDVLLYCTEYQGPSIVDSELVQNLLSTMISSADNTILNLVTHIIHLHCLFPNGRLVYKAEAKLGYSALERLKSIELDAAQYYISLLETIYDASFHNKGKY